MPMIFPARSILSIDGDYISEHSREPMQVDLEKIEWANRTVTGALRIFSVAEKHKLDLSWNLLPSRDNQTVDGYMGGKSLYNLYMAGGIYPIAIWTDLEAAKSAVNPTISFDGRFSSFSYTIQKRNLGGIYYDFWDVSLAIEEI